MNPSDLAQASVFAGMLADEIIPVSARADDAEHLSRTAGRTGQHGSGTTKKLVHNA